MIDFLVRSKENLFALNASKSNHIVIGYHISPLKLKLDSYNTSICIVITVSCNTIGVHANGSFAATINCQSAA